MALAALAACASPTPQVIKETVVVPQKETVVVQEQQTVVVKEQQTVVVKQEVVVTSTPEPTPAPTPKPSGPITLIRYGAMERDHLPLFENQVKGFTAKNPNVTIREAGVPWASYLTKIRVLIGGGETPDVMWFMQHRQWDPAIEADTYLGEGIIVPGDDIYDWKGAGVLPEIVETSRIEGKLPGMPFEVFSCWPAWYQNANILNDAKLTPLAQSYTWDDLDSWLTEAEPKIKADQYAIAPGNWDWLALIQSAGGDQKGQRGWMTDDGTTSTIASEHTAQVLADGVKFYKKHMLKKGDAPTGGIDGFLGEKQMLSPMCTYTGTQANTAKFEYTVTTPPQFKGQNTRITGPAGINFWCASAETKNPDEAVAFAYYCGGQEGLDVWAGSGRLAPNSRYTVDNYVEYAKNNNQLGEREAGFRSAVATNFDVLPFLKSWPKPSRIYTGEYFNIMAKILQPVYEAKVDDQAQIMTLLQQAQDEQNKAMAV